MRDTNTGLHLGYGFAGGLHDPDTGFVRFWMRDYDPTLGRFLSPDPAWAGSPGGHGDGTKAGARADHAARAAAEAGRQVVDPDKYGYCLDDPVNMSDPTGAFAGAAALPGVVAGGPPAWAIAGGAVAAAGAYWLYDRYIRNSERDPDDDAPMESRRKKGVKEGRNDKYEKPPNPNAKKDNKKKGRQGHNDAEGKKTRPSKNEKHPNAEEHWRRNDSRSGRGGKGGGQGAPGAAQAPSESGDDES